MNFKDNLQILRKKENMSQEQLAEKLNVSRQAVSKWETGDSSPEIDKLIQLCDLFNSSMDELVKGKIEEIDNSFSKSSYDKKINSLSRIIASGISLILIGISLVAFLSEKFGRDSTLPPVIFMIFILIAVSMFIYSGIMYGDIGKEYENSNIEYSKMELTSFKKKFAIAMTLGVALIILGVSMFIVSEDSNIFRERDFEKVSSIMTGIFFLILALAVHLFVYFGIQYTKFEKKSRIPRKNETKIGKINGVIMMIATIIFLLGGYLFDLWGKAWIVFVIGGILCGIVSIIYENE